MKRDPRAKEQLIAKADAIEQMMTSPGWKLLQEDFQAELVKLEKKIWEVKNWEEYLEVKALRNAFRKRKDDAVKIINQKNRAISKWRT